METILDDLRAAIYQKGETVFCESVGEYTLPDYLPEIRKLLRIETKLLPTGQFMGNGKAEFTGSTVHTLLYSDENGKLSSAVLNGDYRFAVPLTAESEMQILAESRIDRVSHRLSGPRRIGIRTAIVSDVRFVVDECVSMAQAENSDYSYEKLTGCRSCPLLPSSPRRVSRRTPLAASCRQAPHTPAFRPIRPRTADSR